MLKYQITLILKSGNQEIHSKPKLFVNYCVKNILETLAICKFVMKRDQIWKYCNIWADKAKIKDLPETVGS